MIVSTGSGSSGWLYGAKRVTSFNVKAIMKELKTDPLADVSFGQDTTFKEDEMIAS